MLAWVGIVFFFLFNFFSSSFGWLGFEFCCSLPFAKHSFYSSSNENYLLVASPLII